MQLWIYLDSEPLEDDIAVSGIFSELDQPHVFQFAHLEEDLLAGWHSLFSKVGLVHDLEGDVLFLSGPVQGLQ
jgi:hypothetical protein